MQWKVWSEITNLFGYVLRIVLGMACLLLSLFFVLKSAEYLTGIEFLVLSLYSFFYKRIKDKNFVAGMAIIFFTIVHFLIFSQKGIFHGNNLFYLFITITLFFYGIGIITKKSDYKKSDKKQKKPHT